MLKLALAAGITLTALICGMMSLRSTNFFGNSPNRFQFVNDIKEIFGLPPLFPSNPQPSKSGDTSSFAFTVNHDEGSSSVGGYLPPDNKGVQDSITIDATTPYFRIFVLSNVTTSSTTPSAQISMSTTTVPSSTVPSSSSASSSRKEEDVSEQTTLSSNSPTVPSNPFSNEPSPGFKIDLIWTTLVPPSENEVTRGSYSALGVGGGASQNNGLYLPPSKEYLPPNP